MLIGQWKLVVGHWQQHTHKSNHWLDDVYTASDSSHHNHADRLNYREATSSLPFSPSLSTKLIANFPATEARASQAISTHNWPCLSQQRYKSTNKSARDDNNINKPMQAFGMLRKGAQISFSRLIQHLSSTTNNHITRPASSCVHSLALALALALDLAYVYMLLFMTGRSSSTSTTQSGERNRARGAMTE